MHLMFIPEGGGTIFKFFIFIFMDVFWNNIHVIYNIITYNCSFNRMLMKSTLDTFKMYVHFE